MSTTTLLDVEFTAVLRRGPAKGGTHKLPVRADVRRAIGKGEGDAVCVRLAERFTV
ncbi:DUF1905 domain-containing protein [Streptomyces sp. NPDC008092]|uniref:DUF1905 domain-containing protein n=1 Tax=Streptomyces sp. NPDC008092 TaxID=3364808 RepID=UPI0036E4876E